MVEDTTGGGEGYRLTVGLSTLNHLGVNLYNSVPAIVSEAVANAWDADATEVRIDIKSDSVTITDDGHGMTREECNRKYLTVGYARRKLDGPRSPGGRRVMGRKGIGKLSLFSVADVIEIHTARQESGEKSGFVMDYEKIKRQIDNGDGTAKPLVLDPVAESEIAVERGTMIRLTGLKRRIGEDAKAVRKRLARRFSIIDPDRNFSVVVNGDPITMADRDYFTRLEYVWYLGEEGSKATSQCTCPRERLDGNIDEERGYSVSGWIGTVKEQNDIDDENNKITVHARGKIIHEDMLDNIKNGGIFSRYLIGELQADFLDYDELEDIATTNRQSVIEDDERFKLLTEHVRGSVLKKVQDRWRDLRKDNAKKKVLGDPAIREWYETLSPGNREYAIRLFQKIESFCGIDRDAKVEMYKNGIVAFTTLTMRKRLDEMDKISADGDLDQVLKILGDVDELEAVHYHDISRGRLDVLKTFERMVDSDAKERVLQEYMAEHLWLLDPTWGSVTADERMEKSFRTECARHSHSLFSDEERAARPDIRYTTSAGKHIIVELKRPNVRVDIHKLIEQVSKYGRIMEKLLRDAGRARAPFEVICVLGSDPAGDDEPGRMQDHLGLHHGRYTTYEQLIAQTRATLDEYLERKESIRKIQALVERITLSG